MPRNVSWWTSSARTTLRAVRTTARTPSTMAARDEARRRGRRPGCWLPRPHETPRYALIVPGTLPLPPWAVTFLEQDVELADGLVDLPGAGPADREHGAVTGADVLRLAAVRGDRHPAADDVDGLVGLQLPVGRPRGALPDTHLQVTVGPGGGARRLHRVAGGLGQGAPVLEFAVQRGGGQERGYRGGVGHGEFGPLSIFRRSVVTGACPCGQADCGNGSAIGSVGILLRPCSSKRSSPRLVVSTTAENPLWTRSAAARATPGPHIMPAPPAAATVSPGTGPSGPSPGPMVGRWSGV